MTTSKSNIFPAVIKWIFITIATVAGIGAKAQNIVLEERLKLISDTLNNNIFVNRFESVETPCLCINPDSDLIATPKRQYINSNYHIRFKKDSTDINENGVTCLSQYCSRYMRFRVTNVDVNTSTLNGTVESTYSYPASSIFQYLSMAGKYNDSTNTYFEKLLRSKGTFSMYPENDKYRIRVTLANGPYDKLDTAYGYLEIVREAFRSNTQSFSIYFDQMNIHKGDRNNQIYLRFSSTNFRNERIYHTVLAYNVLKNLNSTNSREKANAIWLQNFLHNPECNACHFIYGMAMDMVRIQGSGKGFSLPNTEPIPVH